ncbi:MAG: SIMPL domain-containing protein [Telluria sp.]
MLRKSIAATALLLATFFAHASQLPEYPFIHVTGNASQYVIPDVGELDFEVVAANADPAAARETVEARVAEIQALVQAQGLSADDVMVRDTRQTIRKGEGTDANPVYQIRCAIHLNVSDLTKWQAIAGGLLATPNLDNFAIDFSPKDREQVETELTNDAIKDARKRAEAMAAGFGRKLGPVTGVSTGMLKNLTNSMGLLPSDFTRNTRSGTTGTRVEKADIVNIVPMRFSQTVDIIFRIR